MSRVVNPSLEIKKLSKASKRENKGMPSVLMYANEPIAWSNDPNVLLEEKAELVVNGVYRYPEMLKIKVNGVDWVFDRDFSKNESVQCPSALLYLLWCRLGFGGLRGKNRHA